MTTIIEAVYDNGVLKPLVAAGLKEQQRYRLIVQEERTPVPADELGVDPEFLAELERRTTILPDGRSIIRLGGIWEDRSLEIPNDRDPVREAIDELRREQAAHFEAELDEFFPLEEKV
ncbi:MAG: antitoxin family protein [Blastocatellia bacterium]